VPLCAGGWGAHFSPSTCHMMGSGRSTQQPGRVIGPAKRTATNFIFHSRFAVHNILQYYFGTGEDDIQPGSIPGDIRGAFQPKPNWTHIFILLHITSQLLK
jgi:hypothetical protein